MKKAILIFAALVMPLVAQNRQMVLVYDAQPGAQWPQCQQQHTCFYDFVDLRTGLQITWDQGFLNGTPYVDSSVDVSALRTELDQAKTDLTDAQAEIALLQGYVQSLQNANQQLADRVEALEQGQVPQPPSIALGESQRYRWKGYIVAESDIYFFVKQYADGVLAADSACDVGPEELCVDGSWVAGIAGPADHADTLIATYHPLEVGGYVGFCFGACPAWKGPPPSESNGGIPEVPLLPVQVDPGNLLVVLVEQNRG